MKNLTQLPWSGKGSKAKNDNTLGLMHGGIRSRIGSMSLKNTSLFGVILALLLTFGVGEMWAVDFTGGKIYFRNDVTNWTQNNIQIFAHQSGYTWVSSSMSAVSNTKLYYVNASCDWGGFNSYRICGNSSAWGSGSFTNQSTSTKYTGANSSYGLNSGSIYLITPASSSNGCAISPVYYSSNDNFLKYTATAKVKTSTNGSSYTTVTSGTWPATVNIKGTYLSGDGATTRSDVATSSGSAGTYDVVATGLVTLTYSSLSSDWSFAGWGTGDTPSSTNESYEYNISAATTVYAFFKKKYTVTFNANGHGSAPSSQKVVVGGKASTPSAPTATGYTFGGWYEEAECTNAWNFSTGTITEDKTLYAKWTAKTYSITLDDNGDYQGNGSATATYGSATLAVTDHAERDDWNLVGYWTASGSGGAQVSDASGNLIASVDGFTDSNAKWIKDATCSLYAHWSQSYSVTYNANGGTGTTTDASSPYTPGSDVTVLSNSFTRTGYTFTGWNTSAEGDGTPYAAGATISSIAANVTLYAQWSEKKTTVTISASPAGTGTFTVNSVSGTSASVGVTTTATIVATPATDFEFTSWAATNCSASPTNNKSTTLTGNGSSASGTLVATFTENVASGWYLGGTDFGNSWDVGNTAYPLTKKYRGMAGVFYRQGTVTTAAYDALHNGTTRYRPTSNATFSGAGWSNKISLSSTTANANYRFKTAGTYYIIADTRGATPVIWYETSEPDRNNYHSVNVTGVVNAKGTCKVTLGSTSGFETTRFANGETFYVTITGVSGWIPTITIGGVATTFNKEAATYTASGTMSTSDVTVAISYTASYTVTYEVGTVKGNKNDIKLYVGSIASGNIISSGTKVKSGTEVFFWVNNNTTESEFCKPGYDWWGFRNAPAGTDPTQYTNASVTVYHPYITANTTVYAVFGEKDYTVKIINNGNGDVYEGGSIVTATTAHVATASNTLTATPQTGYKFDSWDQFSDSLTINSASTAATTIKIKSDKLGDNARLRANYSPRWSVVGTDAFGGWSATGTNLFINYEVVSGDDEGYYSIDLAANTDYEVKVYDRQTSTTYGGSSAQNVYYSTSGSDKPFTMATTSSEKSLTIHSAAAGEYWLNWNLTDKALALVYPTSWYITTGQSDANGGSFTAVDNSSNNVYGGKFVANSANVVFTATPNTGYNFSGWYSNSTCTTPYTAGTGVAFSGEGNSVMTLSGITADKTVYAKFTAKTYTVTLTRSGTGYGSGGTASVTATYNATLPAITLPTAANGYAFMGYYTDEDGEGSQIINASGVVQTVDGYTDADKKWKRDAATELFAYFKQAEITELTLDNAVVAPSTTITVTPTISPTPTGTTAVCWELQYSNGTPLPSQPEFISAGGNAVRFTAPAASATYKIQAKLRLDDCDGDVLDTKVASFQVAGEHVVTILYQDGDGRTLAASTEIEARPLDWTTAGDITPPTITGYTFARWDAGDGVSIKNGDSDPVTTTTTSSIQIKATYDGTLTAVYNKKNMIYFYNTLGWNDVYVYFYNTDEYWDNTYGSGALKTQAFNGDHKPYWEQEHGHMTQIEGTNIWYFDYTAAGYTTRPNVVFTEDNKHNTNWFWKTDVVRRGDHKSSLPMFVPLTTKSCTKNECDYYNDGYWMNYPENTGYTLKIYDSQGASTPTRTIRFPYSEDLKMPLKLDVDLNDASRDYYYTIYREDGTVLSANYGMNINYHTDVRLNDSSKKIKITTTASGIYTFTLVYKDNGGTKDYYISVDYPIGTNDYRVWYSDNAAWSGAAHTGSWYHASDIINKNADAEVTQYDTVSFYIAKGDGITTSMKFQYASNIEESGSVTWTDVVSGGITLSSYSSVITKAGVYNFIIKQVGTATPVVEKVEPYTGNYYIRTDCAGDTKWDSYKTADHHMTYSDYAENNSGYSHYYAHWVTNGSNVKFCIANDFSASITDTLIQDYGTTIANINAGGYLASGEAHNANIRFMWNQSTNKLSRAYIAGSSNITDRFLVLEGDSKMFDADGNALTGANQDHRMQGGVDTKLGTDNQVILYDDENFVYERTIQVQPTARGKLTAKYNGKVQYFIGSSSESVELLGGTSETKYTMRIIYDFKTNRLVTAYIPSGTITEPLAIHADIMLVREHQEAGQQLTFSGEGSALSDVKTVYGVMRFNRWTLNNKSTAAGHAPVGDPKSTYERSLYWISFPFDVNLSDVFGFGTYGTHWIIEYYDGAERAKEGYWKDSEGFWKYITNRRGVKLEAGKGYILALDLDLMRDNNTSFWSNDIQQVELFFPSAAAVENIEKTDTEIDVPAHECTIAPRPGQTDDRRKKDSHWNIIGVPSYANYGETLEDGDGKTITWNDDPETKDLPFLYEWNMVDNTYSVQSGPTYPFKSMHAYMVQYNGKLKWSLASATPVSPVVARHADAPQDVEFRLELQAGEKTADQTFVKMSTDEQISTAFDFNYDLSKQMNSGKANIYTMVEGYIQTAGNCLPMSEQTTVVPVGVKIAADGDYTFAIPDGTEGVGVTLIDQETGIRTSLSALAYTVTLEAGTYDERFVLEISPIHNVPTEQSAVRDQQTDVRKVLIDGLLYIVRDNKMYDARGAMVMEK